MQNEYKDIEGITAILKYNDTILIGKRSTSKSLAPDRWNFIGGRVEEGESVFEACIREVKEETNIDISDLRIVLIGTKDISWGDNSLIHMNTFYIDISNIDILCVKLNEEHSELHFCNINDFKDFNIIGYTEEEIREFFDFCS